MENIGRRLNIPLLRNSLKLIRSVSNCTSLEPTGLALFKTHVNVHHKPKDIFSSKSLPLSGCIRKLYTSRFIYHEGEDSEKFQKPGKVNDLLEKDLELQNILKDIMSDFTDSNPPNQPPRSKRSLNQTEEVTASGKPCNSCGVVKEIPESTEGHFKVFDDSQTEEVVDFDEPLEARNFYLYQEKKNELERYQLNRGKDSVFDIEELVIVLRQEKAIDLAVLSVPDHLHYCKYLVLATAQSPRHLKTLAEFTKKLYKKKKSTSDPFVITEGQDCNDWKVLDMGEIVLHLFLEATRSHYDLETLWTVGEDYDDLSNLKEDPVLDLLQQHIQYLDELEPLADKQ